MSDFESEEKFERSHAIEGRASVSSDAKSDHHHLASTAPPPNTSTIGAAVPLGPDLEAQSAIQEPSVPPRDPDIVTWSGSDDPENPKNWSLRRKWAATVVVSLFGFISPMTSSMVAPSLSTISRDFHVTNAVEEQMMLSAFILAYALGPLFIGPLCEVYGRIPILQVFNLIYLIFNTACGLARNTQEMIVFRFFAGLGGTAPGVVGGGLLADCWRSEDRGMAISFYSLAPLLAPAIGPIAGGFVTENTSWRWVFYSTSIADTLLQLFGLYSLQETYPPRLLHRKAEKLRKETGNDALHTAYERPDWTLAAKLKEALPRPFIMLGTQPIIQFLAIYTAYIYGNLYLLLSTFPRLWTGQYHESIGIGGLNYISLGLGFFLGAQIGSRINDVIFRRLKQRSGGVEKPEFRVPLMVPASILVPVGIFIYGWSAQYHTHWVVPNVGATIFATGAILPFLCTRTYLVDAYTRYAASASACVTVLRSLFGFAFPLFAPYLYDSLGYGWGSSVLGFIAVGIGIPLPFILWFYGARLRKVSPYAAGGWDD